MTVQSLDAPLGGPCCSICGRVKTIRNGANTCATCDQPETP